MRISDWSSDVCYSDLLLLPKLVIGDMLEHLFPEGKLVVSDFGGPVVRRPVAKILIIVIAAGRGDRAAGLVAGLAADPRDIGEAEGAVVEPVVTHPSVDHRAFGRRDLQQIGRAHV